MTNPSREPPELEEGTRLLDRYTIIDRYGSGGMASIYRATDERLDRVVCVKLLRLELAQSGSTSGGAVYQATYSHFLREALALSKLQHPNTLRIYDFGYLEEGGRPFQISEFLDGGNLEQHLRARGAFPAEETLAVLERITGAVHEAHEQKIIHRDIKPSNILFSRVGELLMPKLADFGIAQSNLKKQPRPGEEDTSDWDSVSSIALFSPRWAAPEQLAGGGEGPATDVYALALVTAYMLSGRAPFEGPEVRNTFQERVRGDDLVSAKLLQSGISGDLKRVLLRALAADPSRRVSSALHFFDELRQVLGGARRSLPQGEVRKPLESVTLTVETVSAKDRETRLVQPPEQAQTVAGRTVRVVEVHEKLELTLTSPGGLDVRFRVSIVAIKDEFRLSIKGLNCFVQRAAQATAGTPTPALNASEDGSVDFVSMKREFLGRLSWFFGKPGPGGGRVFRVATGELVVPSSQARYAVALDLGKDHEVIVMCKR